MFEEFFRDHEIQDPEKITQAQLERIEAALQEKLAAKEPRQKRSVKEENIMTTKSIRTIIIAAAIAVVGTAGVAGAATFLTKEQIMAELSEKNTVTEEFTEKIKAAEEYAGKEIHATPWYAVMDVNEYIVTDASGYEKMIAIGNENGEVKGILFVHDEPDGGIGHSILPYEDGGYIIEYETEPIEDEKLLDAIAEGIKTYGDTFVIHY